MLCTSSVQYFSRGYRKRHQSLLVVPNRTTAEAEKLIYITLREPGMRYIMKKLLTRKYVSSVLLLILFLSFAFCTLHALLARNKSIGNSVGHISQLPHIGIYLKEMDNRGDVRYLEKNTLGIIEILFTGHASSESIEKFRENGQWFHISAIHANDALGDIYKEFNVLEKDYPTSYTEEDIVIDTPSIQNVKLLINYMPNDCCFTGKAMISNR